MANKSKKKNITKKKSQKVVRVRELGPLSDPRVRAWDQLLRDPCAANLTAPCYSGTDSGYLVRTSDVITPGTISAAGLTAGTVYSVDAIMAVNPYAFTNVALSTGNSGVTFGTSISGASINVYHFGSTAGATNVSPAAYPSNFIVSSASPASRFRPVAACLKWVPTSSATVRAGSVWSGYTEGLFLADPGPAQVATSAASVMPIAQRSARNGIENHEVRWLPTGTDEEWTTQTSISQAGGTVFMALAKVDATASSATAYALNGYFQVDIVWEWQPGQGLGVSSAPKAPLPYTTQQVLSTITDLGAFIFEGARPGMAAMAQAAGRGLIRATSRAVMGVLGTGYSTVSTRGPALLTY